MAEILPPSPTSSDAVTASEGCEVTEADPSPETRTDGITDVVTSHPNLAPALSDFLEKIAPWKGLMPVELVQHMKFLEDIAETMRRVEQPVK